MSMVISESRFLFGLYAAIQLGFREFCVPCRTGSRLGVRQYHSWGEAHVEYQYESAIFEDICCGGRLRSLCRRTSSPGPGSGRFSDRRNHRYRHEACREHSGRTDVNCGIRRVRHCEGELQAAGRLRGTDTGPVLRHAPPRRLERDHARLCGFRHRLQ